MLYIDGSGSAKTKLMESNEKVMRDHHFSLTEAGIKRTAESYGIRDWKKVLDFNSPNFSIRRFREGAYGAIRKMGLSEAQAELAFGQLLRAGVQNNFNDAYAAVEVTYTAAVKESASNKRQEFYAPLERAGFPSQVIQGDSFPETNFKGLDIEMVNKKWGVMLAFERELMDDDMTGQIVQRAQQLGENARVQEEAYVWARFVNDTTATLDGQPLPVSVTYPTPYSTTGVLGGYGINATTAGRLSQTQIQAGWVLAKKMLDQSGRPFVVTPKILAISPQDVFFAEVLMSSVNSPSVPSATAGAVGGTFAINPIKNLVAVVASRFIRDYGALLIDPKGFNFQRRDPQELVQENPQSGPAFSQEVFRYKNRSRWEADFIDPRFGINLNTSFSPT